MVMNHRVGDAMDDMGLLRMGVLRSPPPPDRRPLAGTPAEAP
jgi:hypothetical protein